MGSVGTTVVVGVVLLHLQLAKSTLAYPFGRQELKNVIAVVTEFDVVALAHMTVAEHPLAASTQPE
jgi:hypothetical protein